MGNKASLAVMGIKWKYVVKGLVKHQHQVAAQKMKPSLLPPDVAQCSSGEKGSECKYQPLHLPDLEPHTQGTSLRFLIYKPEIVSASWHCYEN